MSLFVCSKCGCIDNTATSCYWALVRPCKNRVYDESLKGYEGKPLCFECADISSFERQEKESGFNFLYNPNNGRMRSGHIIIDGIGLFKQIIESGT